MKNCSILLILAIFFIPVQTTAQNTSIELNQNWQFKNQKENKWYNATVPGTVHTDLLANKLIPDPYYRDNESKLQWIDKADWEYKTGFAVEADLFKKDRIEMTFDGLDTYADVYLNGNLILRADNMFRGWTVNVKAFIKKKKNELLIQFYSAQNRVDSIAKARLPLVLPDNNRVYVRKAQFQFGWDWGPKFAGCGIWKGIKIEGWNGVRIRPTYPAEKNNVKLIQQKDAAGTSFYFEKMANPSTAKGLTGFQLMFSYQELQKMNTGNFC